MDLSLYVSIGAVVFAGASALYARQRLSEARKADDLPALLDFLREYRDTLEIHRR